MPAMFNTCSTFKVENLTETFRKLWFLICVFALVPLASSQLYLQYHGNLKEFTTAQLWYEGHWKAVRRMFNCGTFEEAMDHPVW